MSGFEIPDDSGQPITLEPTALETDHSEIELTTIVTASELERLSRYREAGDIEQQSVAFGAFRRISRDGSNAIALTPSPAFSPPFSTRDVFPVDATVSQIAPDRHQMQLTFGLVEPRPREAVIGSRGGETIGNKSISVSGGQTKTVTVTGEAPETFGNYVLTVLSSTDSDTELVSVSEAAFIISWPTAALTLAAEQVGRVQRSARAGREQFSASFRLSPAQAAVLFAAGSRVPATAERQVPDEKNQIRDTLPGDELTATITAPDNIAADINGTAVLTEWAVSWERPSALPVNAEITFIPV